VNQVNIAAVARHGSMGEELGKRCKCNGDCMSKRCACKKAGSYCTDRCHGKGKGSVACQNESGPGTVSRTQVIKGRKRAATTTEIVGERQESRRCRQRG
jgi:hypothetical protein